MAPNTSHPDAESSRDDALVRDPNATPADLHRMASERPDLRPLIAVHPQLYPALHDWLGGLGDPAIDAALAGETPFGSTLADSTLADSGPADSGPAEAGPAEPDPDATAIWAQDADGTDGATPESDAPLEAASPLGADTAAADEIPDATPIADADGTSDTDTAPDADAELVASPDATAADLHRLAGERPDLRAAVAAHPAAYPDLLTWLGSWDDPEINAALASRDDATASACAMDADAATTQSPGTPGFEQASDANTQRTSVLGAVVPATNAGRGTYFPQDAPTATQPAVTDPGNGGGEPPRRSGSVVSSVVLGALIGLIVVLLAVILMLWRPWEDQDTSASPRATATATSERRPSTNPSESPSGSATSEPTGMPYLPAPALTVSQLTAPSGNIACRTDGTQAFSCTIYEHNITDVDGQGGTCDGPLTYHWPRASEPHFSCDDNPVPKGGTTLGYGSSAILGEGIGCTSTEGGMQCWDGENGRGISVARRGITTIDKR